jgi:formylmethanofuran--tetrahydromethanopterin N-formyltransferase
VVRISAGNYGGKLGPYHFKLRELAAGIVQRQKDSPADGAT